MALDLGGLLSRYLNVTPGQAAPDAEQHFDQVAQHASPQVLGQGISDALRSDATPALGQMVSQVFANADPNQQRMMMFMPLIFGFMFYNFPSGLVLYYLTSNLVSMGQQWFFNRTGTAEDAARSVEPPRRRNGRK